MDPDSNQRRQMDETFNQQWQMDNTFNQQWLINKFEEIRRRLLKVISQLSDEQLNQVSDDYSHTIPVLIRHIVGNIQERVVKGMMKEAANRDRQNEFVHAAMTTAEAEQLIVGHFQIIIDLIGTMTVEDLAHTQHVRGKERTHLDMLHQCAAHYSEHMGQIFYIAKQRLRENYRSTSI